MAQAGAENVGGGAGGGIKEKYITSLKEQNRLMELEIKYLKQAQDQARAAPAPPSSSGGMSMPGKAEYVESPRGAAGPNVPSMPSQMPSGGSIEVMLAQIKKKAAEDRQEMEAKHRKTDEQVEQLQVELQQSQWEVDQLYVFTGAVCPFACGSWACSDRLLVVSAPRTSRRCTRSTSGGSRRSRRSRRRRSWTMRSSSVRMRSSPSRLTSSSRRRRGWRRRNERCSSRSKYSSLSHAPCACLPLRQTCAPRDPVVGHSLTVSHSLCCVDATGVALRRRWPGLRSVSRRSAATVHH